MNDPRYKLICPSCNFQHFTDASEPQSFTEVQTAPPPLRADGKNKETAKLPRKFRCPSCGSIFKIIKLAEKPKEEDDWRPPEPPEPR